MASSDNFALPPCPGFRFRPTNEMLVNYYLKGKICGNDSDVDKVIFTIENINNCDPSELQRLCSKPWDDKIYWYFFCKWNAYGKGNRYSRKTKTGSWTKTGKELDIKDFETVSGKRSIFSFSRGTKSNNTKTGYIIHVFEMINHSSNQREPYALCRLHKNTMETKKSKSDIPSAVIPWGEGNIINGEQNNGLVSQSPDSTVLDGDDDISNGNIHLPTAETQAFQEHGEDICARFLEDICEILGVPPNGSNQVMTVDNEGVGGHGVFPPENGHQWSFSQSTDSLFTHGSKVPEAPTATQAVRFDDQANLNRLIDSLDENNWENIAAYFDAYNQITSLTCSSAPGVSPNSS